MNRKIFTIIFIYAPAAFVISSVFVVLLLKWIPVTATPLMLLRQLQFIGEGFETSTKYEWVPLEKISKKFVKAAIAAEDQRFFEHDGFDFEEIAKMKQEHMFDGSSVRGCSTISQQTAKNCFTFCSHSWLRKGVEAYFTVLIEKLWGKRRILEVYLNVAEMGPGIYGVEAAAKKYFHINACNLTMADASSLVCCLPNPLHRDPQWVNLNMPSRRSSIARYSKRIDLAALRK